jgi:RimJ/RimL family protein N-acetyltransferase
LLDALFGLSLRTPRLQLRLPTEEELVDLAQVAERGIHPPDFMPFRVPWTRGIGRPGFVEGFLEFHRGLRRDWKPDAWYLELGVFSEAGIVGAQNINARDFAVRREVESGSWLGLEHQGRGLGTEMREAILTLAFDGLDAEAAASGFVEGNIQSARVSERLGYRITGESTLPDGRRETTVRLERGDWLGPRAEIDGLEPCLPLFGL